MQTNAEKQRLHRKRKKLGLKRYVLWLVPEEAEMLIPQFSLFKPKSKEHKEHIKQEKKKLRK